MLVEIGDGLGFAEPLDVIGAREGVIMHREQAALDQVRLGGPPHADGDVGLAHGEVEFLVGEHQFDADIRIEIEKLGDALR